MTPFDYIRRKPFLVGYAILAAGVISGFVVNQNANERGREAVVKSGQAVATLSCNRDFNQTSELRTIINSGRDNIELLVQEGTLTREQADRSLDESDKALDRLPLPDCRHAADQLTSDPDEDIKVPTPLHPKGG